MENKSNSGNHLDLLTFNTIKNYVFDGLTIQEACTKLGLSRSTVYRKMSIYQKTELAQFKTANSFYNGKRLY